VIKFFGRLKVLHGLILVTAGFQKHRCVPVKLHDGFMVQLPGEPAQQEIAEKLMVGIQRFFAIDGSGKKMVSFKIPEDIERVAIRAAGIVRFRQALKRFQPKTGVVLADACHQVIEERHQITVRFIKAIPNGLHAPGATGLGRQDRLALTSARHDRWESLPCRLLHYGQQPVSSYRVEGMGSRKF